MMDPGASAIVALVGCYALRRLERWRLARKAAKEDAQRPEAWLRRQLDALEKETRER